jgi:hypothetical protein
MPQGLGKIFGRTTQLGNGSRPQQRGFFLGPISWADSSESEEQETNRFINGEYKTKRKIKGATTYGLQISWNEQDWFHMGFGRNEFPKTGSNVPLPSIISTTVPATAPYEISNAFFTTANDTTYGIYAFVSEEGAWGQPGSLVRGTTTPSAGQVVLDAANTKLVFNAAQAGAPIDIPIMATATSIQYYGGPGTATKFGIFELWAEVYLAGISQKVIRHYPLCELISDAALTIDNSIQTVQLDLSVGIPNGWEKPYAEYNLATMTA